MKKALIAGAASVALATMPILGAFATDYQTITDTLNITVLDSCAMERNATTGGTANANNGYSYAATMTANQDATAIGTTTLKVTCNLPGGYSVAGTFTDLDNQQSDSADKNIVFSTTAAAQGSAVWNAKLNGSTLLGKTSATVMSKSNAPSAADGDTATVQYIVSTADNQSSGTYTATATYVLSGTPAVTEDPNA